MSESKLSNELWVEAANTAVYLINRSASKILKRKTPEEVWTGYNFVLQDSPSHTKLQPRSIEARFVGYAEGVHSYKVYDLSSKTLKFSKNVVFIEDEGTSAQIVPIEVQEEHHSESTKSSDITEEAHQGTPQYSQSVPEAQPEMTNCSQEIHKTAQTSCKV